MVIFNEDDDLLQTSSSESLNFPDAKSLWSVSRVVVVGTFSVPSFLHRR